MSDDRSENLAEVIDERVKVYGDPTVTFPQIAQVWSGYLAHEIKPEDVPMMMILMKSVRARQAPDYSDNTDDIEGYLDLYRKLVPEMIHARSVNEYIEKKTHPVVQMNQVEEPVLHRHLYTDCYCSDTSCPDTGREGVLPVRVGKPNEGSEALHLREIDYCKRLGVHVRGGLHTRLECGQALS